MLQELARREQFGPPLFFLALRNEVKQQPQDSRVLRKRLEVLIDQFVGGS